MRRFFFYLIVFFLAAFLGAKIAADPGYVLITYKHWLIEMPVWLAVLSLLVSFLVLYLLIRLWRNLRNLPRRWRSRRAKKRAQLAQELTNQGLLALAAGEMKTAQKKLSKAARYSPLAWVNYLTAAVAYHVLGDIELRDNSLLQAVEANPEAEVAVSLVKVQFLLQQNQHEQALAILKRLQQLAPRQTHVLRLLADRYASLQDWEELLNLLPTLRRQNVWTEQQISYWELQANRWLFAKSAVSTINFVALDECWQQVPRALRHNVLLITDYAKQLIAKGENNKAEELIRKTLNNDWHRELVYYYGLVKGDKPHKQLATAEAWLSDHENDATLLLTLGRLSLLNQLWGKARTYFQASINQKPTVETYAELGRLHDQLGDSQAAKLCYQTGLQLAHSNSH